MNENMSMNILMSPETRENVKVSLADDCTTYSPVEILNTPTTEDFIRCRPLETSTIDLTFESEESNDAATAEALRLKELEESERLAWELYREEVCKCGSLNSYLTLITNA
jgi:hypothetical protein